MSTRSVPELVLDEAADVLGDLADWLREAPRCPRCMSLPGCSHEPGCALGRVLRLRCLLGSGSELRREEELRALRRERGCVVTLPEEGAPPDPLAPTVRAGLIEPGTPPASEGGAR